MLSIQYCLFSIYQLRTSFYLSETWHRYDGVVMPLPGKEYYSWLGYHFDTTKYEKDVTEILQYFVWKCFPQWDGNLNDPQRPVLTAMDAVETVDMLHSGLWQNYGEVMKKWYRQAEKFRSDFGKVCIDNY